MRMIAPAALLALLTSCSGHQCPAVRAGKPVVLAAPIVVVESTPVARNPAPSLRNDFENTRPLEDRFVFEHPHSSREVGKLRKLNSDVQTSLRKLGKPHPSQQDVRAAAEAVGKLKGFLEEALN